MIPAEVAQALSYLANLIDSGLEVRGANESPRAFAARYLEVPTTEVAAEELSADYYEFFSLGRAGVEFMEESAVFATMGYSSEQPPTWSAVGTGDRTMRYPVSLYAALSHQRWPSPIVLGFSRNYQGRTVSVLHRSIDATLGAEVLDHLRDRAAEVTNPFRGSVMSVTACRGEDIDIEIATHRRLNRTSVVLPDSVWGELDVNVGGLLDHFEEMAARGLSATRGLLLWGPPGTGKTAAIRAIVTELEGRASVLMCDAKAAAESATQVMRLAADLAPSIVVIEDIDRLVSGRNHSFLVALDGVEVDRTGVVVIATANDMSAMGPAVLRSARFDVKIEVPLPDAPRRRAILGHYLGDEVAGDLTSIVAATEGASGADLREIVSAATLEARAAGGRVTLTQLLAIARDRFAPVAGGLYL